MPILIATAIETLSAPSGILCTVPFLETNLYADTNTHNGQVQVVQTQPLIGYSKLKRPIAFAYRNR